ncbi:MAG: hypothetical protein CM15mP102_14030 [Flavobacteriales bacterium]|nr:MAG: hypothetical protein CM15mP102_14030 [Flavobacteriales bacterium]
MYGRVDVRAKMPSKKVHGQQYGCWVQIILQMETV